MKITWTFMMSSIKAHRIHSDSKAKQNQSMFKSFRKNQAVHSSERELKVATWEKVLREGPHKVIRHLKQIGQKVENRL